MNNRLIALLIICFTFFLIVVIFSIENGLKHQKPLFTNPEISPENPEPIEPPSPKEPETPLPNFEQYTAQRNIVNLGKVLSDIEGHMPAGHIYKDNDKITWGHETTHGINSDLRQKFSRIEAKNNPWSLVGTWVDDIHGHKIFKSYARINGFYVLEDKAVIIKEPNTTITAAAKLVPGTLRGGVYQLYMIHQAQSWDDTPLYVFDEWTAYGNGAAVRLDLEIKERNETVKFMLEFNVYAICVAQASQSNDEQLKSYLKWNIARSMKLYKDSKEKLRNARK